MSKDMATEDLIPDNPKVTVLMSVYNGERYLNEAIESILAQTFTDFEYLIIDDASTDRTPEILCSYGDLRIRIVTNEENFGLTKTLNKGLSLARGEYIARMDADDISMPNRLRKQFNFMEKNPDVGVCGTNVRIVDENGKKREKIYCPLTDSCIKSNLFFCSSFVHPSVFIRRNILDENLYDSRFRYAQDYELWVRLSKITNFENIKEALLLYRVHSLNIGKLYSFDQIGTANIIRRRQLIDNLKLDPNESELSLHFSLCNYDLKGDMSYLVETCNWLNKVKKMNEVLNVYPEPEFTYVILERFISACNACKEPFIIKWNYFFKSNFYKDLNLGFVKIYFYKFIDKFNIRKRFNFIF